MTGILRSAALLLTLSGAAQASGWDFENTYSGRIQGGAGHMDCGGTLVGSDLVVTAAHCLFDRDTGAQVDPRDLTFSLRLPDASVAVVRVEDLGLDPLYVREEVPSREQVARDVAFLRLAQAPATGSDEMAIADPTQTHLALLTSQAGEPQGEPCEVTHEKSGIMVLACARQAGASGSPVYGLVDGERRLVGVISAAGVRNDLPVTFAASPMGQIPVIQWVSKTLGIPTGY